MQLILKMRQSVLATKVPRQKPRQQNMWHFVPHTLWSVTKIILEKLWDHPALDWKNRHTQSFHKKNTTIWSTEAYKNYKTILGENSQNFRKSCRKPICLNRETEDELPSIIQFVFPNKSHCMRYFSYMPRPICQSKKPTRNNSRWQRERKTTLNKGSDRKRESSSTELPDCGYSIYTDKKPPAFPVGLQSLSLLGLLQRQLKALITMAIISNSNKIQLSHVSTIIPLTNKTTLNKLWTDAYHLTTREDSFGDKPFE